MIDDVMKVRLVAASLVAALLASPVILDACLFTCHTPTLARADEQSGAPSCHHSAEESDARFEPPPASCGHDHSPAPSTITAKPTDANAHGDVLLAVLESAAVQDVANRGVFIPRSIGAPLHAPSRASTPLRI